MGSEFKKGLYRFTLVIEKQGETETVTLYRNIRNRSEADGYSKGLLDLCDMQQIKWKSVEWTFDEYN